MRTRLILQALLIQALLASSPAHALTVGLEECMGPLGPRPKPLKVSPWTIEKGDLALTSNQLLPPRYLHDLNEAGHSVAVDIAKGRTRDGQPFALVYAHTDASIDQLVLTFTLVKHPTRPGAYVCENLRAQHPSARAIQSEDGIPTWQYNETGTMVRSSQVDKGIPFSAMSYAFRQIMEVVRAAGGRELVIRDVPSYPVARLLRYMGKMRPANPTSERFYETLDAYYKYARELLPPEHRVSTAEQFQHLLEQEAHGERAAQWNWAMETRTVPANSRLLWDASGKLIGVHFKDAIGDAVYFINPLSPGRSDPLSPERSLFFWRDLDRFPQATELTVPIGPR